MSERWALVPFDSNYEASTAGRIRRATYERCTYAGRLLRPTKNTDGYLRLRLTSRATMGVASIVAATFLGPKPNGREINHKNGIKTDNRVENLEYVTRGQNISHSFAMGLRSGGGERNANAKLTAAQVRSIRNRRGRVRVASLAREYGVAWTTIKHAQIGFSWKEIA